MSEQSDEQNEQQVEQNESNEFMEQIEQFLPQLEICKKKIMKKVDAQAEKLQKYKLYKAKIQRHIDMYTQQYAIIENDIQILQTKLSVQNVQLQKSKISEVKNLKEDVGRLLEVFVYIQTGKENNFENIKGYLSRQNTIDLNLNFMDYSSIDLLKLQEIWRNKDTILSTINNNKSYSKYQTILKQVLEWINTFYEVIIKNDILQNIEQMYTEYEEKKESYQNQFTKNDFIYKYYNQLYQQLQNYIKAIQTKNPLIDEVFAENLTKLIEEIFKKDNQGDKEDQIKNENRNIPLQVVNINNDQQIIRNRHQSEQTHFKRNQDNNNNNVNNNIKTNNQQKQQQQQQQMINIPHKFANNPSPGQMKEKQEQKDNSDTKLITVITSNDYHNNQDEQSEQLKQTQTNNPSFKSLLNNHHHKSKPSNSKISQVIQIENIQVQDDNNNNNNYNSSNSNSDNNSNNLISNYNNNNVININSNNKNDNDSEDSQQKIFSKVKSNSTHNLNLIEQSNEKNDFQLNNSMMNNYEISRIQQPTSFKNGSTGVVGSANGGVSGGNANTTTTLSDLLQAHNHSNQTKINSQQKYFKIQSIENENL